jgi:RimJ/RimL family protein N-acetyltransferase
VTSIRRLRADDAHALVALRRAALESEPFAFAASVDDDRALSIEFVQSALADDREQAVFGHLHGSDLTGMVGVARESKAKRRHMAFIWGMYVAPSARNAGGGRALLEAAIAHARRWPGVEQLQLGVTDTALPARRLYERLGFRAWGREPRALSWQGRFVDEHHLVLTLGEGAGGSGSPR